MTLVLGPMALASKALHGFAPDYSELCIPASSVNYRSHLRSATQQGYLTVLLARLARCDQRAFAYAAPYIWNSLPTDLQDYNLSLVVFKHCLKSNFSTRPTL